METKLILYDLSFYYFLTKLQMKEINSRSQVGTIPLQLVYSWLEFFFCQPCDQLPHIVVHPYSNPAGLIRRKLNAQLIGKRIRENTNAVLNRNHFNTAALTGFGNLFRIVTTGGVVRNIYSSIGRRQVIADAFYFTGG